MRRYIPSGTKIGQEAEMPVSEVHHVAMIVSDCERSSAFYEEGLGYRRTLAAPVGGVGLSDSLGIPRGTSGRIQYLQGPSRIGQLELIEWDGAPGPPPRSEHRQLGPFLLSFEVPEEELEALHDRLVALGAESVRRPMRVELENYGYITAFAARDPDGIMLEFVALPSREEIRAFRNSRGQ
jgi:catechol 2,3-dioxygenase-like lactoylglutathione lyase family enzyme